MEVRSLRKQDHSSGNIQQLEHDSVHGLAILYKDVVNEGEVSCNHHFLPPASPCFFAWAAASYY